MKLDLENRFSELWQEDIVLRRRVLCRLYLKKYKLYQTVLNLIILCYNMRAVF